MWSSRQCTTKSSLEEMCCAAPKRTMSLTKAERAILKESVPWVVKKEGLISLIDSKIRRLGCKMVRTLQDRANAATHKGLFPEQEKSFRRSTYPPPAIKSRCLDDGQCPPYLSLKTSQVSEIIELT